VNVDDSLNVVDIPRLESLVTHGVLEA